MVVAKRQRNGKVHKNGTKENPWTRVRTSGETNRSPSWLALVCIGQARWEKPKHIKRGSQDWLRPLLQGQLTFMRGDGLSLPNKTLSCNEAVTLVHRFKSLLQ